MLACSRLDYYQEIFSTNRVFYAFIVDACLYSVWQSWLLGGVNAPAAMRYTPFLGLAAYLLTGAKEGSEGAEPEEADA